MKKMCKSCAKHKDMHKAKKAVHEAKKAHKAVPKAKKKVKVVMEEFKRGDLHSGSKKGPRVTNPKQAIAIALSEQRKASKKSKK